MNDDDHTMQTMMITPELLGLIPSSASSAPPSGKTGFVFHLSFRAVGGNMLFKNNNYNNNKNTTFYS